MINSEKGKDNQYAALDRTSVTVASKFQLDTSKLQSCTKDPKGEAVVAASVKQGESLEVSGTPTMFVNGQMLDGARPASEIRATLDAALKRAGVAAPAQAPAPAVNPSSVNTAPTQH